MRNFFAKRSKDRATSGRIRTINLLDSDKKMLIKGEIFLRHCKGHDALIIYFDFDGFYTHICLIPSDFVQINR